MATDLFADRDRVLKRVTEILNLCDPGTYSATLSARNKTRNATAIADAADEAGLMVLTAMAEHPNEFRQPLIDTLEIDTVDSGELLDEHIGPPVRVSIQPFAGADWVEGEKSDRLKIDSYRLNPEGVYDSVAHDQDGSRYSGKYDIWEDRFFFTGYAAEVDVIVPPTKALLQFIPIHMESIWVKLAVGNNGKLGTGDYVSGLVGAYWNQGMADLEAWKNGKRVFSEVDEPKNDDMHVVQ